MNIPTPSRKTLMVAGGIALLGVLAWLALRSPAQLASLGTVTRGPLEVSFQEEGKTRIQNRYIIAAPVAGTVRRITLQAGDAVQAGQTLVEMEPGASTLLDPRSRSQAQADVRSAQAQLHAARKRSAAAQASQQLAQADWQRAQSLHPSGAIARQELDQARARHDAAQAELGVARADEQAAAPAWLPPTPRWQTKAKRPLLRLLNRALVARSCASPRLQAGASSSARSKAPRPCQSARR